MNAAGLATGELLSARVGKPRKVVPKGLRNFLTNNLESVTMPTSVPMLRDRFRRGRAGAGTASASAPTDPTSPESTAAGAARGRSYDESRSWAGVGMFAAGIAVGALLGAGVALLYAPQSGIETRLDARRKARRLRAEAAGRWDELAGGLRKATRQGTKRIRRSATRARWATADAFDD
jgi:hypothetical protein